MTNTENTPDHTIDYDAGYFDNRGSWRTRADKHIAEQRTDDRDDRDTENGSSAEDVDHCFQCGYDLGTHHPTCGMSESERLAYLTFDARVALAELMIHTDANFWALMRAAQTETEGWWQYTDEHGDTYTTNSEY